MRQALPFIVVLALFLALGCTQAETPAKPDMPPDHPPIGDKHPPVGPLKSNAAKPGDEDPHAGHDHPPMDAPHGGMEGGMGGGMGGAMGGGAPGGHQLVVPDDVAKAFKAVTLKVAKKDGSSSKSVEAKIGETTVLPDTGFSVTVEAFLPAFYMDSERISSVTLEPNNPAAKVAIKSGDNTLYTGWMFSKMPTVHAFEHPEWTILLEGGVSASPPAGAPAPPAAE